MYEKMFLGRSGRRRSTRKTNAGNPITAARKPIGPEDFAVGKVEAMELSFSVSVHTIRVREYRHEVISVEAGRQLGLPQDAPVLPGDGRDTLVEPQQHDILRVHNVSEYAV